MRGTNSHDGEQIVYNGVQPPKRDGKLGVWIDGKEALTCTEAFFRTTDRVSIRRVLDQARLESHLHFKTGGHLWVDNLVVAGQYIGPMEKKREWPIGSGRCLPRKR